VNTGNAVRAMADNELSRATWRKAARSQANGDCVEVAALNSRRIAVRDSKNANGPALVLTPGQWRTFLAGQRRDGTA
jgi:uncharacterized protein DUF397